MGGQVLAVEAGVSRMLPVSVLLGTDVLQLVNLLSGEKGGVEAGEGMPDEALAVTTRAQTRRNAKETILREQRQLDSWVQPRSAGDELEHRDEIGEELEETGVSVETDGEPWIGAEFDQDLFQCAGVERLRQTRRQKRLTRREHVAASGPDNLEGQLNRLTASKLND